MGKGIVESIAFLLLIVGSRMFYFDQSIYGTIQHVEAYKPQASSINDSSKESVASTKEMTSHSKRIFYWTTFFHWKDFNRGYGGTPFKDCPVSNCETTADRKLLSQSDAVLFHPWNMDRKDMPQFRTPEQRWIFFSLESPANNPTKFANITALFNWTMTYRWDSDIVITYMNDMKQWFTPDSEEELQNKLKGKKKLVAWIVSHCSTAGHREEYVEQLKNSVPVDIYGRCGKLKCPDLQSRGDCLSKISQDYKFYLSLENSVCRDYVTEKFFRALANYVLPIVNGGMNYSQLAPPGSFIDIRDFRTPKDLGEYLKYLDKNQTAYEQYFLWRKTYLPKIPRPWCQLCEMLNDSTLPAKSYPDISDWFVKQSNCGEIRHLESSRANISLLWTNVSLNSTTLNN